MNRLLKFRDIWISHYQPTCGPLICNRIISIRTEHIESKPMSSVKDVKQEDESKDKPIKFSTSKANVNYRASYNFYGDDRDLPPSHNYVIVGTFIFSFYYLIFLRDEQDEGGALGLLKPLHETLPHMAIPLLRSAIIENRRFGNDTKKLEEKLAEYMKDPKKYGGE